MKEAELILVVGSDNSSNTQALVRVAKENGVEAHRIDQADEIQQSWLDGVTVVGLTAGASAPDHLVQAVIERVDPKLGFELFSVTQEEEYFPLPPQLRNFVSVLQMLVEASVTARPPTAAGWLETDRDWTATEALELL